MTEAPQILLAHHRKILKLPTFLREYEKLARQCAAEGLDHVRFLARLVELELIDRERRMIERRIKAARFPAVKSLDSFDFKAIPSLNKMQVLELARCKWIERIDKKYLYRVLNNRAYIGEAVHKGQKAITASTPRSSNARYGTTKHSHPHHRRRPVASPKHRRRLP
jgi:hypothetical protein